MTASTTARVGRDLPTRKLVIALVVLAIGLLVYFTGIKPAVREHTLEERAARRAACSAVPPATEAAILAELGDTGGRVLRSMRAKPAANGWWFVSANFARPDVPRGFTGEMATWRVRDEGGRVVESVDRNAKDYTSFTAAPLEVQKDDQAFFDSRWCAKNAALSP